MLLLLAIACVSPEDTGAAKAGGPADTAWDTGGDDTAGDTDADDTDADDTDADDTGGDDTGEDSGGDDTGDTAPDDTAAGDPVADFALEDRNRASPRFGELVSPRDYLERVSGWYFIHAT